MRAPPRLLIGVSLGRECRWEPWGDDGLVRYYSPEGGKDKKISGAFKSSRGIKARPTRGYSLKWKAVGPTLKYRASRPMWVRFRFRLPTNTSEIVDSAILASRATSAWE